MNFNTLLRAALRKRAAAVLTPEAEQAAMQPPQGSATGIPPQDPSMMGGAPGMDQGPNGGQIPPEIMQDQQFIQWLASQGVQFDPQSGQFFTADGQPLPADAIMQAYQQYQAEMQGQMPPEQAQQGGQPPQDPSMAGGAPAGQGPNGGQIPPEIMQDQQFIQFMQQVAGVQLDPNSGSFADPQSGQPLPPDMVMQAYQAFQQQMQQQGGQPTQDPSMMGGAPGMDQNAMQDPSMTGGQDTGMDRQGQPGMPPELLDQLQSMIDSAIENYTAQLDRKLETFMDKLDSVKQAVESMRDTDDKRTKEDKSEADAVRDEIAADLMPVAKTASVRQVGRTPAPRPMNMFEMLVNRGTRNDTH